MCPEPRKPSRPAIVGLLYLGGVFALLFGVPLAIFGPFDRLTGIVIAVVGVGGIVLAQQVEQFGESSFSAGADFEHRRMQYEISHVVIDDTPKYGAMGHEKMRGPIGKLP